jgi:hypothetical protein
LHWLVQDWNTMQLFSDTKHTRGLQHNSIGQTPCAYGFIVPLFGWLYLISLAEKIHCLYWLHVSRCVAWHKNNTRLWP